MRRDAANVRVAKSRPLRVPNVASRLTGFAAGLLAIGLVAAGPGTPPAWAAPSKKPTPFARCIVLHADGTFQAVFGYEKGANPTQAPIGPDNTLSPSNLNGAQPTSFQAGRVEAAFATNSVASTTRVAWTLFSRTATATRSTRSCGPEVSLPGEGNGIGAVLVLAISVLVSIGLLRFRLWRERQRGA